VAAPHFYFHCSIHIFFHHFRSAEFFHFNKFYPNLKVVFFYFKLFHHYPHNIKINFLVSSISDLPCFLSINFFNSFFFLLEHNPHPHNPVFHAYANTIELPRSTLIQFFYSCNSRRKIFILPHKYASASYKYCIIYDGRLGAN
jgi:hypothetical protein